MISKKLTREKRTLHMAEKVSAWIRLAFIGVLTMGVAESVWAQRGLDVKITFGPAFEKVNMGDNEYLQRAKMFLDTALRYSRDEDGRIKIGVDLETMTPKDPMDPNQDINVYRLLYLTTYLTGDSSYARMADTSHTLFFRESYGMGATLSWGEGGATCEHAGVPSLMDDYWRIDPSRMLVAAQAYWETGIYDKENGFFNRHCNTQSHMEYPRHGAFYMFHWGEAFKRTLDQTFMMYISRLVGMFESIRDPEVGYIPTTYTNRGNGRMWQNLSAGVEMGTHLPYFPQNSQTTDSIRQFVLQNDDVVTRLGFPNSVNRAWLHRGLHLTCAAMPGEARYWQLREMNKPEMANMYRDGLIELADRWIDQDLSEVYSSGQFGHAIHCLIVARYLSGNDAYVDRAKELVDAAIQKLWQGPLPVVYAEGSGMSKEGEYTNGGGSDNNSGVAMLPLAIFMLGYELEHPNSHMFYPSIDR